MVTKFEKVGSTLNFFEQAILNNLRYWNQQSINDLDIVSLDRERDNLIRAISFGLKMNQAWELVYPLIIDFTPYLERKGYWDTLHKMLTLAINKAKELNDLETNVVLLGLLARLLQRQSKIKETIATYRRTVRLARKIGKRYEEARACSNLGFVYLEQGYFYRSKVLSCYALKIFEVLNYSHGLAHTHSHLGVLYFQQGIWKRAKFHLGRAFDIWCSMEDRHGLMRGLINLGLFYLKTDKSDKALLYLKEAVNQAKLSGEEVEIATIYFNISVVNRLNGNLEEAERYIQKAEKTYKKFSNSVGLAYVWNDLGMIYVQKKDWQNAKSYLEASLEMWRKLQNEGKEIEVLLDMIEYELAQDNKQQACKQLEHINDLINQYNVQKKFPNLMKRFRAYRCSLSGNSPDEATAH